MITPYPRQQNPYDPRDEEEEPIRSPQEIYETQPDPDEQPPTEGSATGDDREFLEGQREEEERYVRQRQSFENPYEPEPEPEPEPEYPPSDNIDNVRDQADLEGEGRESEKTAIESEWFEFRVATAHTPSSVNGVTKRDAFKQGWTADEWVKFADRTKYQAQARRRTQNNIRSRNGFEIGWRPSQPAKPMSAAPRRNVGAEVSAGIERGYDLLGLSGFGMAAAMNSDLHTQQSISDQVFGTLPRASGGRAYDILGIGFATEPTRGGSPDLFGFGGVSGVSSGGGGILDLFGFGQTPRQRVITKPKAKPKNTAKKPTSPKRRVVTSPKKQTPSKTAKKSKQMPRIPKKASSVKKTTAKKTTAKGVGRRKVNKK